MDKYTNYEILSKKTPNGATAFSGLEKEVKFRFKVPKLDERNKPSAPILLNIMGITNPDPNYEICTKRNLIIDIEYIVSGSGYIDINGLHYDVNPGDAILLLPGTKVEYGSSKNDPYKKVWINFSGDMAVNIIKDMRLDSQIVFRNCDIFKEMNEAFSLESISVFSDKVFMPFFEILMKILTKMYCVRNIEKENVPSAIAEAKKLIDSNILDVIDLNQLIDKVHISKALLINQFKAAYGQTPKQYIINSKIELAKTMLLNTSRSIKDIAEHLSFFDQYAFTKLFKRKTGKSPKDFRKTLQ